MEIKQEVDVLVDLQFGSTGKGALAGFLSRIKKYDTVVTAWMPNAGHTYVDQAGNRMIHTALANGIVSPNLSKVLIAPASVVDIETLKAECQNAERLGYMKRVKVFIHQNATILQPRHSEFERNNIKKIGSTQKGSGAAIIEKIERNPDKRIVAGEVYPHGIVSESLSGGWQIKVVSHQDYKMHLNLSQCMLVEGAQGYSLGVNSGFYPYTTSRECTVAQVCSDTLISPDRVTNVYGCARTYPIRVANRYDENGIMYGWSGPAYPDQIETSFEFLNQKPEYTTVTKLKRRVFRFSKMQIHEAIETNMPSKMKVFLNFANYVADKEDAPDSDGKQELQEIIDTIESTGVKVKYIGWGASHQDMQMV